ncbi:MAG: cytochrome c oxidase subunit II [Alphaproteobacteria bacterium]|nr:cytochrome c oxidase subunit II [Alphaproteobacteria bacterium]
MTAQGTHALEVLPLTWGVLIISLLVTAIISVLVVSGILLRRVPSGGPIPPVARTGSGMRWIYIGVGLSTIVLFGTAVWTMRVLAAVISPPAEPAFTVTVDGRQWWWRIRYHETRDTPEFITANEIRIPVGVPVRIRLTSTDVIHSFWVPALSGKTDLIPGRINETWIEATAPGVYRGQCMEYCGWQHARMGFVVVAMEGAAFDAWRASQVLPASEPQNAAIAEGKRIVMTHCCACHTIRGTEAGGSAGPDLTHVASRLTIAAGTFVTDRTTLEYWIRHPQRAKPGNRMVDPDLDLEATRLPAAYILKLR